MDISSASSSRYSQLSSEMGTNVAKDSNDMTGVSKSDSVGVNTNQAIEQVQKLSKQRAEYNQQFELSLTERQAQIDMLVKRLDEFISSTSTGLSFRMDEKSGKSVVTVYEVSSGDIIRQIPEKEMLELYQQLSLQPTGIFDKKV